VYTFVLLRLASFMSFLFPKIIKPPHSKALKALVNSIANTCLDSLGSLFPTRLDSELCEHSISNHPVGDMPIGSGEGQPPPGENQVSRACPSHGNVACGPSFVEVKAVKRAGEILLKPCLATLTDQRFHVRNLPDI
jgi:hypothetical protein